MAKQLLLFLFLIPFIIACESTNSGQPRQDIPGKLVFGADDEKGNAQIFTMNADGSRLRQLTNDDGQFPVMTPAWSPDGRQIVYAQLGNTTLGAELYVMDADGDNKRPFKRRPKDSVGGIKSVVGSHPAWSPDGTRIAYQVCSNCEIGGKDWQIVTVETAGETFDQNQLRSIASHPASDEHPAWSPDGSRIVFSSGRDFFDADTLRFRKDLYMVNADGSGLERLTETGFAFTPVWGPDNSSITYWSTNNENLIKIHIQTRESVEIDVNLSDNLLLGPIAWTPDGRYLFVTARKQSNREEFIYLIDSQTNEAIELPFGPTEIVGGDWFVPPN